MAETEQWTIGRLLEWTTDYLRSHGSESPRLDAEILLAHARGCTRIELYTSFSGGADEALRQEFRELVKQRAAGRPVAYLVGHREFFSLDFHVTSDVLIPRPETEHVIVALLDRVKEEHPSGKVQIADVGTGSGIIGVTAAKRLPSARVTAVDLSPAGLDIARQNAARHDVADRIEFLEGDLLQTVPPERPFDYVVSNPPYVSESEYAELDPGIRDHEPQLALLAGPTGTDVIRRLIPAAAERLNPGGWLLFEISPMIAAEVRQLVTADGRFDPPIVDKDLAGLERVVCVRKSGD